MRFANTPIDLKSSTPELTRDDSAQSSCDRHHHEGALSNCVLKRLTKAVDICSLGQLTAFRRRLRNRLVDAIANFLDASLHVAGNLVSFVGKESGKLIRKRSLAPSWGLDIGNTKRKQPVKVSGPRLNSRPTRFALARRNDSCAIGLARPSVDAWPADLLLPPNLANHHASIEGERKMRLCRTPHLRRTSTSVPWIGTSRDLHPSTAGFGNSCASAVPIRGLSNYRR